IRSTNLPPRSFGSKRRWLRPLRRCGESSRRRAVPPGRFESGAATSGSFCRTSEVMGQKTNPIGLRIAVNKDWRSKWYAEKKEFGKLLAEDRRIRDILKKKLESASVPKIQIERAATRCRITIFTARPGVVIGR